MNVILLSKIGFCNLENHDPIRVEWQKVFVGTERLSAYGVMSEWMAHQPPEKLYFGYNEQVYPQFRVENKDSVSTP